MFTRLYSMAYLFHRVVKLLVLIHYYKCVPTYTAAATVNNAKYSEHIGLLTQNGPTTPTQ